VAHDVEIEDCVKRDEALVQMLSTLDRDACSPWIFTVYSSARRYTEYAIQLPGLLLYPHSKAAAYSEYALLLSSLPLLIALIRAQASAREHTERLMQRLGCAGQLGIADAINRPIIDVREVDFRCEPA
jgi:hypothetical protein